jgi:polysaccharide biosynthesis/export protein
MRRLEQVERWVAVSFFAKERNFPRIMGWKDLWQLERSQEEADDSAAQLNRRPRKMNPSAAPVTSNYARDGVVGKQMDIATFTSIVKRIVFRFLGLLAITGLAPSLAAQAKSQEYPGQAAKLVNSGTASSTERGSSDQRSILSIGNGDLLEISVSVGFGAPEMNWKGRVGDSGDITLPLVGSIHVVGLTVERAEASIEKIYRDNEILKSPQVSVFISEYASQGVSVLGEVAKPGVYPEMSSRRLLDLISQAGGFTPTAGDAVTITHRGAPMEPKTVVLAKDPSKTLAANIEIFPGDTIVVTKAGVVYVVGAVVKPGGFTIESNEELNVLQAIALAQGTKSEAALDKAKLIRKTPGGPKEISISLSQILASKAPDIKLLPEDIVFVPSSTAKTVARRSLEAIVQTATGVAIYGRY